MDKSEVGIVQDIPCTFIFNWSCDSSWLMSHQSTNIFHEISLKALTSGGLLQRNILENVLIIICKSNQINNIINFYRIQFLIKSIDGKMLPSIKNGQEWCGYCAGYSLHFHIQLKLWLMTHESTNIFHEISLKALTSRRPLQRNILENVLIIIYKSNQINNIINFYRIQFLIKSIDVKFEMWPFNKQWLKQEKKSKIQLVTMFMYTSSWIERKN